MHEIPTGELHRTGFEAAKSFLQGEPILSILFLAVLSIGGTFLKAYMESIRETKPTLFTVLLVLLCLLVLFSIVMMMKEWKS